MSGELGRELDATDERYGILGERPWRGGGVDAANWAVREIEGAEAELV